MPRPTTKEFYLLVDDFDTYGRGMDEEIDELLMELDRKEEAHDWENTEK